MWRFLLRELTGQTDTSDQAYMKSKKGKTVLLEKIIAVMR